MIKNAFRCCGLYPFNPNKVDYSKCISNRHKEIRKNHATTESDCDTPAPDTLDKLSSFPKILATVDGDLHDLLDNEEEYILQASDLDVLNADVLSVDYDKEDVQLYIHSSICRVKRYSYFR